MTKENVFWGALTGLGAWFLGLPWELLYLWVLLMILDIITGVISACLQGNFSSREMKFGLFRKTLDIAIMVAILTIQRVASLNGFDVPIGSIIVGAFCIKEGTSIIENYAKSGGKLPITIQNWLKVLGQKIDGGGQNDSDD
jgi:toxin secretion/phage lysis holin